jgi:hypothetical protein
MDVSLVPLEHTKLTVTGLVAYWRPPAGMRWPEKAVEGGVSRWFGLGRRKEGTKELCCSSIKRVATKKVAECLWMVTGSQWRRERWWMSTVMKHSEVVVVSLYRKPTWAPDLVGG